MPIFTLYNRQKTFRYACVHWRFWTLLVPGK